MRRYLLGVICAALVSGTVQCLFPKPLMKFLCGIFLTLTIVLPLTRLDLGELQIPGLPDGEPLAAAGETMAREARARIIKQQCEAYILDKAHCDGLQVEVTLGDDEPVPVGAALTGRVSPYDKGRLERLLQQDLGIPKENVEWTG